MTCSKTVDDTKYKRVCFSIYKNKDIGIFFWVFTDIAKVQNDKNLCLQVNFTGECTYEIFGRPTPLPDHLGKNH